MCSKFDWEKMMSKMIEGLLSAILTSKYPIAYPFLSLKISFHVNLVKDHPILRIFGANGPSSLGQFSMIQRKRVEKKEKMEKRMKKKRKRHKKNWPKEKRKSPRSKKRRM